MASSYALPASAMTHSHSHHGHLHSHSASHSTSPNRGYPGGITKSSRPERGNMSLHTHSASESHLNHGHDHNQSLEDHGFANAFAHGHIQRLPPTRNTPFSNGLSTIFSPVEQDEHEREHDQSHDQKHGLEHDHDHDHNQSFYTPQIGSYEPPVNDAEVKPHFHGHHGHKHGIPAEPRSKFTSLILPAAQRWPLLHTILAEKDSRRIFYFMSLNFAFMLVQAFYGYITDSLGLLSDSIHMFFDCLALAVGLFAAVAAKWPASERFPYGFGKIESLSGFGNGVFLMLISIEIMIEATERIAEGRETKRLAELFIVSAGGLAVNLVGMACFGHHGHAGHDHGGHSHGHSHSHSDEKPHAHEEGHHHGHDHNHDHSHDHSHSYNDHKHTPLLPQSPSAGHSHAGHDHSHDNENMHGIFLHVLADTMGSAAVMVSTALIYFVGWSGWDPLASCVIAILIFLSSIPLIKSSARKLLLTVPDGVEYNLRATISGVSDLRGVASYSVPRFWIGDQTANEPILGVMHIVATRGSDLEDVKERTRNFLLGNGMDVVVQVEKDGDTSCWCGGSSNRSPSRF